MTTEEEGNRRWNGQWRW